MKQYDHTTQTVGNIVHLEHLNCLIDDQRLATLFYVVGLGGTRDPYIFMGLENMFFTNSGSRRDISAIVRPRAGAGERNDSHLMGRRAARGG